MRLTSRHKYYELLFLRAPPSPLDLYTPVVSTRRLPDLTTHGYVLSPAAKPACTTLMRVSVCGARELCHNEQSRGGKGLPPPFFFIWSFCTRSEHDHNNILKQHACLHHGRLVSSGQDATKYWYDDDETAWQWQLAGGHRILV